jgi:hypothetical protein
VVIGAPFAFAQSATFTYQGRLNDGGRQLRLFSILRLAHAGGLGDHWKVGGVLCVSVEQSRRRRDLIARDDFPCGEEMVLRAFCPQHHAKAFTE